MNRDTISEVLHFIDGERIASSDSAVLDNIEPATGEALGTIAAGSSADVEKAVTAANRALPRWSQLSADTRSSHLEQLAAAIEENLDELATAESIDNGKPISASPEPPPTCASSPARRVISETKRIAHAFPVMTCGM